MTSQGTLGTLHLEVHCTMGYAQGRGRPWASSCRLSLRSSAMTHIRKPQVQAPLLPLTLGCPSPLPGSGKRLKEAYIPPQETGWSAQNNHPPAPQTGIS